MKKAAEIRLSCPGGLKLVSVAVIYSPVLRTVRGLGGAAGKGSS